MIIQKGHSLLELLISITIFALGLLGLLDFDCKNFRQENNALLKAYGINQMKEAEIFILNTQQNTVLSPEEVRWNTHNQQRLPQGNGELKSVSQGGNATLTWFPLPSPSSNEDKTQLTLTIIKAYNHGK